MSPVFGSLLATPTITVRTSTVLITVFKLCEIVKNRISSQISAASKGTVRQAAPLGPTKSQGSSRKLEGSSSPTVVIYLTTTDLITIFELYCTAHWQPLAQPTQGLNPIPSESGAALFDCTNSKKEKKPRISRGDKYSQTNIEPPDTSDSGNLHYTQDYTSPQRSRVQPISPYVWYRPTRCQNDHKRWW